MSVHVQLFLNSHLDYLLQIWKQRTGREVSSGYLPNGRWVPRSLELKYDGDYCWGISVMIQLLNTKERPEKDSIKVRQHQVTSDKSSLKSQVSLRMILVITLVTCAQITVYYAMYIIYRILINCCAKQKNCLKT
jgi:hypothetical protein